MKYTCPLCGKDLTAAIELLGKNEVFGVHKAAHLREAINDLVYESSKWPEKIQAHFKPLACVMTMTEFKTTLTKIRRR